MEKAIEIVENKIQEVEQYIKVPGFKERLLILNDVLKELKSAGEIKNRKNGQYKKITYSA